MNISSITDSIGSLGLNTNSKALPSQDKSFQNMLNDAISEVNGDQVE